MPARAAHASSSPWLVRLRFTLLGGLVCQVSPSPPDFLCTLSLHRSSAELPSLRGVHPPANPLSPPDMLAGETSQTASLSPCRNFLLPLFQNASMAMLLQPKLPASAQHTFILVTATLPAFTDPWMLCPQTGSCTQQSRLILLQILLFPSWDSTGP